jgi:hypothetical protein
MRTDLAKHMTVRQQRRYIFRQQSINAGLAHREGLDATRKARLANIGHNTLIVERMQQEAGIADQFSNWRARDAVGDMCRPPHPPKLKKR